MPRCTLRLCILLTDLRHNKTQLRRSATCLVSVSSPVFVFCQVWNKSVSGAGSLRTMGDLCGLRMVKHFYRVASPILLNLVDITLQLYLDWSPAYVSHSFQREVNQVKISQMLTNNLPFFSKIFCHSSILKGITRKTI